MRPDEPSDLTRADGDESEAGTLRWGRATNPDPTGPEPPVDVDLADGRWGPTGETATTTSVRRWGRRRRRTRSR